MTDAGMWCCRQLARIWHDIDIPPMLAFRYTDARIRRCHGCRRLKRAYMHSIQYAIFAEQTLATSCPLCRVSTKEALFFSSYDMATYKWYNEQKVAVILLGRFGTYRNIPQRPNKVAKLKFVFFINQQGSQSRPGRVELIYYSLSQCPGW